MSIRNMINTLCEIFNMQPKQIVPEIGQPQKFQGTIQSVDIQYVNTQLHGRKALYFIEAIDAEGRTAKMIMPVNAQGRNIVPIEGALIDTTIFKTDTGWNRYVRQDPGSWLATCDFTVLDYTAGNVARPKNLLQTLPR